MIKTYNVKVNGQHWALGVDTDSYYGSLASGFTEEQIQSFVHAMIVENGITPENLDEMNEGFSWAYLAVAPNPLW